MDKSEFKQLRSDLDLTQKEMANQLGIGWRMYAYIESGARNAGKSVTMLAEELRKKANPHPN